MKIVEGLRDSWFTHEFNQWFGNSVIKEENGRPRVVYHGTTKDFDHFDHSNLGAATGARTTQLGTFFTDNELVSGIFAHGDGGNIRPCFLKMTNPLELGSYTVKDRVRSQDGFTHLHAAIAKIAGKETWDEVEASDVVAWRERVKQSYDGIIIYNTGMDGAARTISNPYSHFYIVFDPANIRSVFAPNTFLDEAIRKKYLGVPGA